MTLSSVPSKFIQLALALPVCAMLAGAAAPTENASLTEAGKDSYLIQGSFSVAAPQEEVWRVLTDYAGLKGVVTSMESSEVLERKDGVVLVKQQACGSFLCFTKSVHLLLKVRETPFSNISFEDQEGGSFKLYRGQWNLAPGAGGVKVDYLLEVNRGSMAPEFLEKKLFKSNALDLLRELRVEILRRTAPQAAIPAAVDPPLTVPPTKL